MTAIIAMADSGNHHGNGIWPTLETASRIFDLSSFGLISGLVVGAIATVLIVWMGIVKEHHWDVLREQSNERVASLELETAKANAEVAKAHEGIANANTETAKANEMAALANERAAELKLTLDREIASRQPRTISASQRSLIVELLKPDHIFKGKVVINAALEGEAVQFSEQVEAVLKEAGFDVKQAEMGERALAYNMPGQWIQIKDAKNQPKHGGPIHTAFKRAGIEFIGQAKPDEIDRRLIEMIVRAFT